MKEISKEYYKLYRSVIIQLWAIAAVCVAAFAIAGAFKNDKPLFAVIVCGFFVGIALFMTLMILLSPKFFEAKLKKCSNEVQNEILSGKYVELGARRFYENHLLFFSKRKINLVRYDEIKSADIKSIMKIELTLENGKKLSLATNPDENSAIIAAAFKSKNPQIKFIINGKIIDVKESKK